MFLALADLAGGFKAVHFRHLDIHEDDVERLAFDGLKAFDAVLGDIGLVAEFLKETRRDLLVDDVVIAEQHVERQGKGEDGFGLEGHVFAGGRFGAGDGADEGIFQEQRFDGFSQATGKDGSFRAHAHGSEQDEGEERGAGQLADFAREHDAIHAGHLHVEDGEIEGFALAHPFEGLGSAAGGAGDHAPLAGLQGEDAAVGGVIVHDEEAQVGELRLGSLGGIRLGGVGGGLEWQVEMESGTLVRDALDPHVAAHEFDEALADGEAETGTAVLPSGRGVGLAEGLEEAIQAGGRDADASVAHGELAGAGSASARASCGARRGRAVPGR